MIKALLDYLFPKNSSVERLEKMTAYEFSEKIAPARKPEIEDIKAIFSYKDPLIHEVLWEIKYKENRKLAELVAPLIIDYCLSIISDESFFETRDMPIVTFIPATALRKEKRGFDQGEIILGAMGRDDKEKRFLYKRNILRYARPVIQQSLTKNRGERFKNMEGAFGIVNENYVRGKTIILLDDVCTTGATLMDAKRALEGSGARKVYLLAIAH